MAHLDLREPDLAHRLWIQDGVVSRQQLLDSGARPGDIERMLRRRELTRVVDGIFVDHSGPLIHAQREWVAVLAAWPAALTRESVLPDPPRSVIHIAVAGGRHRLHLPRWVVTHRTNQLFQRADGTLNPPRVATEHALIDVMETALGEGDVARAFADLSRTAFARTTPDHVLTALAERRRVRDRATIEALVTDLRDGACSVLERGYLRHVERAHRLPRGDRQHVSTATGRRTVQDVRYAAFGVVVELDGAAHHSTAAQRDADARRDLAEQATSDALTARVTYGLVFTETCTTAARIGAILRRRGWTGALRPCPRCPPAMRP